MVLLEICCYSMECAVTAQQNGADRIELCSATKEGGLTPSLGVLHSVRQNITIPVHPIIRPRGGDFCYTEGEFAGVLKDVEIIRTLGFPGLVVGLLDVSGHVDMHRMEAVMSAAGGMSVTFHRAFDMCVNPLIALNDLASLGVQRVLTSGQKADAVQGLSNLIEYNQRPDGPVIMAGAGVRSDNIGVFLSAGLKELHSSAGKWIASPMRFRHTGLSMSADAGADEYSRYVVDGDMVAAMKAVIDSQDPE